MNISRRRGLGSRVDAKGGIGGLIVGKLTMIDDNGSCSPYRARLVFHVTEALACNVKPLTSLRVCKF